MEHPDELMNMHILSWLGVLHQKLVKMDISVNELDLSGETQVSENIGQDRVDFSDDSHSNREERAEPWQDRATDSWPGWHRPRWSPDITTCRYKVKLTLGDGVRMANDGASVVATIDGRPMIMDEHITVLEIYEIAGDVDYSTGNIRFDGHVVVQGLVLDDFEIHCRSLEVHGIVGSALIRCEADATFHGGVNGHHRVQIVVGGQCMARYLNEVTIRVDEELKVERGITNSDVACIGSVLAERIVGVLAVPMRVSKRRMSALTLGSQHGSLGADFQREALRSPSTHCGNSSSTWTSGAPQSPAIRPKIQFKSMRLR